MDGNKGRRECIVTIINDNIATCRTFNIMYESIKRNSPNLLEYKWFVLFPSNMELNEFLNKNRYKGVKFVGYQAYKSEDIYTIKFMLINFIEEIMHSKSNLTYIDADHIFLKPLMLQKMKENEMMFSSENSIIQSVYYGEIKSYNASFLRASYETWLKVMYDWIKKYEELKRDISSRFREEIAFSLSVQENNICISQLDSNEQSNFQKFNKNCCFFHYGGEYSQSKLIKKCIENLDNESINFGILSDDEIWILNKLYGLWRNVSHL